MQELVQLHGGTVQVASVEGQGTTFTIDLPAGKAHLPADRIIHRARPAHLAQMIGPNGAPYVEEALRWLPEEPRADGELKRRVAEKLVAFPTSPFISPSPLRPRSSC